MRGDRIGGDGDGSARALLWRLSLVVALALATVFAGLGGSASAAVTGLERIAVASPSNSAGKSVTASCPPGKQVVGAGGDISGGFGEVTLGFVKPNGALTSVSVQGREDENGWASNWFVTAYAICAPPPPGLALVTAASPNNSANKAVTATCPAGKKLLGTGAEVVGGGGQAAPNDVSPDTNLKAATVQGLEDENGTSLTWRARAFAICANPVAGLERVVATSPTDSVADKIVTATCPAGKQVLGAGAALGSSGEVVLDDLTPAPGLTGVSVRGDEDEDGTAANWFARSFAICAAASERITSTSSDSSVNKIVPANCPGGKQPTGGGGDITGGGGQVALTGLVPATTNFSVTALEDGSGFGGNWTLRGYAICAPPLPGQEVVSLVSVNNSSDKAANVFCPSGKRVVGGGGQIADGFAGEVVLDGVVPQGAPATGVSAFGFEDESGFGGDWTVTAFAICALPPPGLELVTAISDADSDLAASATATCPSGKNLIGTGADITAGSGQVVLDDVRPDEALTRVTVTGFEDENGTAANWSATAHAFCANP